MQLAHGARAPYSDGAVPRARDDHGTPVPDDPRVGPRRVETLAFDAAVFAKHVLEAAVFEIVGVAGLPQTLLLSSASGDSVDSGAASAFYVRDGADRRRVPFEAPLLPPVLSSGVVAVAGLKIPIVQPQAHRVIRRSGHDDAVICSPAPSAAQHLRLVPGDEADALAAAHVPDLKCARLMGQG